MFKAITFLVKDRKFFSSADYYYSDVQGAWDDLNNRPHGDLLPCMPVDDTDLAPSARRFGEFVEALYFSSPEDACDYFELGFRGDPMIEEKVWEHLQKLPGHKAWYLSNGTFVYVPKS